MCESLAACVNTRFDCIVCGSETQTHTLIHTLGSHGLSGPPVICRDLWAAQTPSRPLLDGKLLLTLTDSGHSLTDTTCNLLLFALCRLSALYCVMQCLLQEYNRHNYCVFMFAEVNILYKPADVLRY